MGLKPRKSKSSGLKTQASGASVSDFIGGLSDERRRDESKTLVKLMRLATGWKPVMWGTSIVGFGSYHYKYATGREGDWPRTGFSPRKGAMTVYCMPGFKGHETLLARLGPHTTGVSCLYIKRLDDVDLGVLTAIVKKSLEQMKRIYGERDDGSV